MQSIVCSSKKSFRESGRYLAGALVLGICAFNATLSSAVEAPAFDLPANRTSGSSAALHTGDKVNLAVFERIEHEEDKWASPQQRLPNLSRSFVQRAEVSGERIVEDDGNISLPFIGQVAVAGLTDPDVEKTVAKAFEQVFHRPAFVTVLSVEHMPVYIVGPVKNQGSYKYVSGMTVLHAIALAGGLERSTVEPWQAFEAVRAETGVEHARIAAIRMLARLAVLRSERDGTSPTVPPRLAQLVGNNEAIAVINDERALRSLVVSIRSAREASLRLASTSAKSEFDSAKERLAPLDGNIKLRNERLEAMSTLSSTGVASKAQLAEVKTALLDVEGRKQDALAALASAKHKLEQVQEELNKLQLENKSQLELDIAEADKEIAQNLMTIDNGREIIKAIQANNSNQFQPGKKASAAFEILRRTANGPSIITAQETTELEPGDLVRVKAQSITESTQVSSN